MAAKKTSATAHLAAQLVQTLEAQRSLGAAAYPLPLSRLIELTDPHAVPELVAEALKNKAFTGRTILARKKDLAAPVALREDLERLAGSPLLLEFALAAVCTPESPTCSFEQVARKAKLETALKAPFTEAVRRLIQDHALPATVGSLTVRAKVHLYLQRLPPPRKPEAILVDKLVETLQAQRDRGLAYPTTLQRLVELADPQATPALVTRAVAQPVFAERILVAQPKQPAAPIAFREDLALLAGSPLVLQFVLDLFCTPAKRLHPPARLAGKLIADLQTPFLETIERQRTTGTLPTFAAFRVEQGVAQLYLRTLPPLDLELADRLLHTLEECRQQGGSAYPTTLGTLLQQAEAVAGPTLVRKALALPALKDRLLLAVPKHPETPLAFLEDQERLLASPLLLQFLLRTLRTEASQGFTVNDLKKKLPALLQAPFTEALDGQLAAGKVLAEGVGWLLLKTSKVFFLLEDLHGPGRPTRIDSAAAEALSAPPVSSPPVDFGSAFDEAFNRLDRAKGSHNFVSLVDLRQAVPADRAAFDSGLHRLRVAGRYTLSAAEGRHGISQEERDAGILEDGTLLLHVSRRSS